MRGLRLVACLAALSTFSACGLLSAKEETTIVRRERVADRFADGTPIGAVSPGDPAATAGASASSGGPDGVGATAGGAGPGSGAVPGPPGASAADLAKPNGASDTGVTATEIRLGIITSLSGGTRPLGEPPYKITAAFVQDQNARGGIHGRRIKLIAYDACLACPEEALAAAKRLVEEDHVFAIVNTYIDNTAMGPVIPYIEAKGVPMIQGLANTQTPNALSPHVFYFGNSSAKLHAAFAKGYLTAHHLPLRVAIVHFRDPLNEKIDAAQRDELARAGITVTDDEEVPFDESAAKQDAQVTRERASNPSLVIGVHGVACGFNMVAADNQGWKVPYQCHTMWGKIADTTVGKASEGRDVFIDTSGWAFPTVATPQMARFNDLVARLYPDADIGILTVPAFAGMSIFEDLAGRLGADLTRDRLVGELQALHGYDSGLSAPLTTSPDDHVGNDGTMFVQLVNHQFKLVTPTFLRESEAH